MILVPSKNEILILPLDAELALYRLQEVTMPTALVQDKNNTHTIFNGEITNNNFTLSKRINYPQNFLPLIKGRIEASSRGCIIFINYSLFRSSLVFLIFWTVMILLAASYFVLHSHQYLYAAIVFLSSIINYSVAILNFNKQIKTSREALEVALKITA